MISELVDYFKSYAYIVLLANDIGISYAFLTYDESIKIGAVFGLIRIKWCCT